jgi:hypothetical protein
VADGPVGVALAHEHFGVVGLAVEGDPRVGGLGEVEHHLIGGSLHLRSGERESTSEA